MMEKFLLPLLLLGTVTAAHAGTIAYSNLGAPKTFDPVNGWSVDGGAIAGQQLAVQFSTNQVGAFLAGVEMPLGIIFSDLSVAPFTVYIAADDSGLPGADLADLTLGGPGVGAFPPGGLVTYGCGGCLLLEPGTLYWVVAGITNSDNDHFETQAEWNWNLTNDFSSGANFAFNDTQFGGGWQLSDNSFLRPAFQVNTVPEPGSVVLIGLGLAGLSLWSRRRILRSQRTS